MINEDKIIQNIKNAASCRFIGDDAALLPPIYSYNENNSNRYVIAKDLLVEGVHFRTSYFSPIDLAHKALHVNLSDIAAMGAEPMYILCGISIPNNRQNYAISLLSYLTVACEKVGIFLIGGDTTTSQNGLFISITALGKVLETNVKYRKGAKPGDVICVAGNLGFAHLGFLRFEKLAMNKAKYINSFLRPQAKIKEGIWLGSQQAVTTMMDISDGLYIDLQRLALNSNKQAVVDLDLLQSHLTPEVSLQIALEGGEDYGLLMTIEKEAFKELSQGFSKSFNYDLKVIGNIAEGDSGVLLVKNKQPLEMKINPFTHFK